MLNRQKLSTSKSYTDRLNHVEAVSWIEFDDFVFSLTFRKILNLLLKMVTWMLGIRIKIKTGQIRRKKRMKQKLMMVDKAKKKLMNR